MIYYKCDCCGYEINESGTVRNFVSDEKLRNMYQIKSIHEDNSDTLEGLVFCHKCLSRMYAKSVERRLTQAMLKESVEMFRIFDPVTDRFDNQVKYQCPVCYRVFSRNFLSSKYCNHKTFVCNCGQRLDNPEYDDDKKESKK